MFTCCPNCETVFKVSAKHLQQAAGKVRCGRCDFSFNALSNLQENASEAAASLKVPADKGEDTGAPPDAAVEDPDQRVTWQRRSAMKSSSLDTWGAELDKNFKAIEDEEAAQIDLNPEEEPDTDSEDSGTEAVSDELAAATGEIVLVEDAEAFEAAVLATIHATESEAWESGPHLAGGDAAEDDGPSVEGSGIAEPADDDPDAGEDAEWLSKEAQDTDLEADPDQPSMDFLERLAEGAGEEADLEDIEVDDEDESAEATDEGLQEDVETSEPVELVEDDLMDDEHGDEPDAPPAEEPGEEESAAQDSGQVADEADLAHAEGGSGTGNEDIWLGEITLESAEKDELEFDVPGNQVDTVFLAADEETTEPVAADEKEGEPGDEASAEMFDPNLEGTEEIILSSDDVFDFEVAETEPESGPKPVGDIKRRFAPAIKYRRPAAIAGAVALAFLLLAQLTHYFRYQILENGALGPLLEGVYSGLGIPLTRQWDLEAYDIRRTRVVGNEAGTGVVEISAILSNRATFAQPYPILRLIFTDQWDEALAIRDLHAGEYLQTDPGDQARMAPGEQVAVDIRVMELADNLAQNYRIEYCLQDSDQNLHCK